MYFGWIIDSSLSRIRYRNRRSPVKHDAGDPDFRTLCRYRALVAEANDMPPVRGENKYLYLLAHQRMNVLLQPSSSLGNVYKPHDTTHQMGVPSRFIALRTPVASRSRSISTLSHYPEGTPLRITSKSDSRYLHPSLCNHSHSAMTRIPSGEGATPTMSS
jgi:hypothetical protein